MKEQMKRTVYEAPVTELIQIELEGAFMSASVHEDVDKIETTGHELNDIELTDDHQWNTSSWE